MQLTYLGHSAFKLERDGFIMIIDPYADGSVPGLKPLKEKANQVVCSHKHADHFGFKEIKILVNRVDTPFMITPIASYHDEEQGSLRGENNITVIDVYDHKAVHMGDIGCELDEETLAPIKDCELLMIPVGGFYTLPVDKVVKMIEAINPKIIIPMHYRGDSFDYDVLGTVDEFLDLMKSASYDINRYDSQIEITADTPKQIAVMTPLYSK